MTLTLTILGCGSSAGVPRPALGWGACDPDNPRNRRRRCSLLAERTSHEGITRIVIDTPPEALKDLAAASIAHLDAGQLGNEHADRAQLIDDVSQILHEPR